MERKEEEGESEDKRPYPQFKDVDAEFRADIRNALGDLAAVDSDQVTSLAAVTMDTRQKHNHCRNI